MKWLGMRDNGALPEERKRRHFASRRDEASPRLTRAYDVDARKDLEFRGLLFRVMREGLGQF